MATHPPRIAKRGLITVSIPNLRELDGIPGAIERAENEFTSRLQAQLVLTVRASTPRGSSGRLEAAVTARRLTETAFVVGYLNGPGRLYARPLDRGSFRRATGRGLHVDGKPRALAFRGSDGAWHFRKWVRLTPRRFFEKGVSHRRAVGERIWADVFGDITKEA